MSDVKSNEAQAKDSVPEVGKTFRGTLLFAIIFFVVGLSTSWVNGGPDTVDGVMQLSATVEPVLSVGFRGVAVIVSVVFLIFVLNVFAPSKRAIFTRITQRLGPVLGALSVFLSIALVGLVFVALEIVSARAPLVADVQTIAFSGAAAGGVLQLMAAAVRPDPNNKGQRKAEESLARRAREDALQNGECPEEAEEFTRHVWKMTGEPIARVAEGALGFTVALTSGGLHNAALFLAGASFLLGLGYGVSGAAFLVLYLFPVVSAIVDTTSVMFVRMLVRLKLVGFWRVPFYVFTFSFVSLGCFLYKSIFLYLAVWVVEALGGPGIDLEPYFLAMISSPFGLGLAGTLFLGSSLLWIVVALVSFR